ncbi:MAG: radical SAM protein [Candidatus Uhrbacteria bacterium]|nr:B12-binding domain-containing radical SAM protein [Patescibacteria group bacterium]MBU1907401.1 B12-binding domain-containing radical SAM protein [Patescibacteria group bacterium]
MTNLTNQKKVLLVYPRNPISYWGFQYSAKIADRESFHPPLALITVAAMLPQEWNLRLIDLNRVQFQGELRDEDILWADVVLTTAMIIQKDSLAMVLKRCAYFGVPTVAGGPFVKEQPDAPELESATALFLGEAEDLITFKRLVQDLDGEITLRSRYQAKETPVLEGISPTPRFDLLGTVNYHSHSIQISRGCPKRCKFCSVQKLYGREPRYKSHRQVVAELEAIYQTGFRGNIFVVDDNLTGHPKLITPILMAMLAWQQKRDFPFLFYTQVSIDIVNRPKLLDLMVRTGFQRAFIGLESPSEQALENAGKGQNLGMHLPTAVEKIQEAGMMVDAGLIIFHDDGPEIFAQMREFVRECRIDSAMVGLEIAIPGTELYDDMREERLLLGETDGDQFGFTNIQPTQMSLAEMYNGYRKLLRNLYSPWNYFTRAYAALKIWNQRIKRKGSSHEYGVVPRSLIRQGIFSTYRLAYWWFMAISFFTMPRKIAVTFSKAIAGHHYIRYTFRVVSPRLRRKIKSLRRAERAEARLAAG